MTGTILVNPRAGRADVGIDVVRDHFPDHHVRECDPAHLPDAVSDLVSGGGASFVGIAGGDGTLRAAASRLRGGHVPLLPIPAGTRNHLARDLGIDSIGVAALAAQAGTTTRIDLGEVNGTTFVNTLSIGVYPQLVRRRELHEERFPKPVANGVAAAEQLVRAHRSDITVEGVQRRAWAVFVGNGAYGTSLGDLASRDALDDGRLDVRVIDGSGRFTRLRVTLATLTGRVDRSPLVHRTATEELTVDIGRRRLDVALDGEVVRFEPPLTIRCLPRALLVLVPPARDEQ